MCAQSESIFMKISFQKEYSEDQENSRTLGCFVSLHFEYTCVMLKGDSVHTNAHSVTYPKCPLIGIPLRKPPLTRRGGSRL